MTGVLAEVSLYQYIVLGEEEEPCELDTPFHDTLVVPRPTGNFDNS